MTILTRDRSEEKYGHYTKTLLWVTGAEGTVATEIIDGPSIGRSVSVAWCTSTPQPDSLLSEDCPFRGGRCYGESLGFKAKAQVVAARLLAGWPDAVTEVLEELYRQEFES